MSTATARRRSLQRIAALNYRQLGPMPCFRSFRISRRRALNGLQIQVGESLEADAALAATHLAQLREMRFHDVALADIKCHVVLLRSQGAKLAERFN